MGRASDDVGFPPQNRDASQPETLSNGDLAALIGKNGLTIVGAVTFLLSIPANTISGEFSDWSILYGYGLVIALAVCAYIFLGGLESIGRKSVAGLFLLVLVVCIFATPPLFSIWNSARNRAADTAVDTAQAATPTIGKADGATAPEPAASSVNPFRLEITQR